MYYYQNGYYYYPVYYPDTRYYPSYRQPAPVNSDLLCQSATETKKLMDDAVIVLDKLSDSKEFDEKLMNAAQISDYEEVDRLIHSLGLKTDLEVHFNPDGLRLEFKSDVDNIDCCRLTVALRWR
ncbi:hypothetical protein GCM10011351_07760 [Paraliobacillus quinghaiensis]|uniref:Inner spore coat protein n=1 Tax=Paraliobacillus quinghaiensis TaxID=470815 RepID=A0A917WR36_9BACI|nr:hypothetical protein [Paraliobacillus quinghaiensis]GGM24434.1 hypothetical protein GCM10011351_07760 [Paraliobacillus quinghaiensis]